jgi:hypothetical protein
MLKLDYPNKDCFPNTGKAGVIYRAVDTDTEYYYTTKYLERAIAPPTPANPRVFQGTK